MRGDIFLFSIFIVPLTTRSASLLSVHCDSVVIIAVVRVCRRRPTVRLVFVTSTLPSATVYQTPVYHYFYNSLSPPTYTTTTIATAVLCNPRVRLLVGLWKCERVVRLCKEKNNNNN